MNTITPRTDLNEYLPDWYKPVAEYQRILEAEIPQFVNAAQKLQLVHDNMYLDQLEATGAVEWEKIFGITGVSGEDIETRRWRIKQRLWMHPPFTERYLRQRLDEMIGANNYTLTMYRSEYRMVLTARAVGQAFGNEVIRFVNRIKPAHIVFEIELLYNTWNDWHPYTWNQMGEKTWQQAREEPIT